MANLFKGLFDSRQHMLLVFLRLQWFFRPEP